MEEMPICKILESSLYGGMKIQIGYCNGKNSTFNGFEYHKGSEINIAVSDFMISLGHVWQIQNNHFNNDIATFSAKSCHSELVSESVTAISNKVLQTLTINLQRTLFERCYNWG